MSIFIQKAGILSTVQDLGRLGYRRFGINPGGVMDRHAARLINVLLGNYEAEPVLEMHFPAAEIMFEKRSTFTVGGADFTASLDDEAIDNWRAYQAPKGGVLKFMKKGLGNRAYLAVAGGFAAGQWLGSSSTNMTVGRGGIEGRKLQSGDKIKFGRSEKPSPLSGRIQRISPALIPRYSAFPTVRVIEGAEYEQIKKKSKAKFEDQNFSISNNSNRMGFRLEGEPLSLAKKFEMVSSAVSYGTIQLFPDGQLIVLMADHQTAGGYPRVAHVIDHDLPVMAQLGARDKVAFQLVPIAEAEALNSRFERDLAFFRVGRQLHQRS